MNSARRSKLFSGIAISVLIIAALSSLFAGVDGFKEPGKQAWGYVQVRPGAFMFWWLYYSTGGDYMSKPLVIWLQGGPGASSTGFGNFEEIGPQNVKQENRSESWVKYANVLFIDNPVGCGFSYVNDTKLLVKNNTQIAQDLVTLFSKFLEKVPEFQKIPLYIFSESYGGKMAAQFSLRLSKQIEKGKIKCNFKGVSLGDSWISPVDSVLTWAPFLYSTSLVDNAGFAAINASAYKVKAAVDKGQFLIATNLWEETENVIGQYTNGVNVYNILQTDTYSIRTNAKTDADADTQASGKDVPNSLASIREIFDQFMKKHPESTNEIPTDVHDIREEIKLRERIGLIGIKSLRRYHSDPLDALMNGPIKEMLRIIPENVTWGGQKDKVFAALAEDFMKPVVNVVENLLNNTPIGVNVYSGQLDLIVDTMGTTQWVDNLNWPGIVEWKKATRKPIIINNSTEMFVKSYKNFGFYWVLKAGHMVPLDEPLTGVELLKLITNTK